MVIKTAATRPPIVIPDDKLQFLKKKLDDPNLSPYLKRNFIRKIMGGHCAVCQKMPTKIVSYDMDGVSLIERYCDKCLISGNENKKEAA
jgi:hypothetical protein